MGNGGREIQSPAPESQRGSEFSMESANDKIRARPFRHTKFQNVSASFFLFGASTTLSRRPLPQRARDRSDVERRSRDISIILKLAVFNFHERFWDPRTRSRRKTVGEEMTIVYRARRKKDKFGRKGSDGESDFKALSLVNPALENSTSVGNVLRCILYGRVTD